MKKLTHLTKMLLVAGGLLASSVDVCAQQRTWDFSTWSEKTVANLKADAAQGSTEGWSDIEKSGGEAPTETSKDNCFWSVNTPDEMGGLSANKILIDELKGLKFGTNVSNRGMAIAVNYPVALSTYHGGAYLWLGGANKEFFTIPAVKGGSTITMGVESHKTTEGRGVKLIVNGTSIGEFAPTTYEEHTWEVTGESAVNVVVDNTNGCHIYFIEVEQDPDALLTLAQSDLANVIAAAKKIDVTAYEGGVAAFKEALDAARAVDVASATAEEMNEAAYALIEAKAGLTEPEPVIMTYTVNEVVNGTVVRTTTGEALENMQVSVPYRQYNVLDGKLYSKGATSKEFNHKFTLTTDGQVETINYSATSTDGVVYLSEGEDIEGMTVISTGNAAIRSSNSAAGYAKDGDIEFTTLDKGKYKLAGIIYDSGNPANSEWTFLAGGETIANVTCTVTNVHTFTSEEFIIEDDNTPMYIGQGGGSKQGVDLIYIIKTGEYGEETPIYAYTVNEVAGGQVVRTTTGEAEKGTHVTVPYRKYNVADGQLYTKGATDKQYNYTFTVREADQVENINYTIVDGVDNMLFIAEGEDMEGLTPITTGNAAIRSSNSAAGHVSKDTEIVTLTAGTYTLHAAMYNGSKTEEPFTFKVGTEEKTLMGGENFTEKEFEFTINETTMIVLCKNTAANKGLDAIYIAGNGELATEPMTVGGSIATSGYSTFSSIYALDLTTLPADVTAYVVAEADNGVAKLTEAPAQVPAKTGLIIAGEGDFAVNAIANATTAPEANLLVAGGVELDGEGLDYILYDGKFHRANKGTVAAGKAYLHIEGTSDARELTLVLGDATSISDALTAGQTTGAIYNLNGQRVAAPTKGLYIVNGKKAIVK